MLKLGSVKNPKGPDFTSAPSFELNLSGTKIRFNNPPNSDGTGLYQEIESKHNIYDSCIYSYSSKKRKGFNSIVGFRNSWLIHGFPIFQGEIGFVHLGMGINKSHIVGNFLNHSFCESEIERNIMDLYGPVDDAKYSITTRVDWQTRIINGNEWIHCKHIDNDDHSVDRLWYFPITDQHLFSLNLSTSSGRYNKELEPYFDQLMNDFISTIEVELSEDALLAKQEAEVRWPDQKYSEYLPPIEFEMKELSFSTSKNPEAFMEWLSKDD